MPKTFKKLPSFNGVGAGQMATLTIPIGRTMHGLYIAYSGVTLAQMTNIQLVINGKPYATWASGEVINQINMHNGREDAAVTGILVLDFDRFGMEHRAARELTAIGTGHPKDETPITTMHLQIDISANAGAPSLSCSAETSAPTPLQLFQKTRRYTYNPGAAGAFEISDLPRGDLIQQVFFRSASMNALTVERDSYVEFERTIVANRLVQRNGVREPQENWYVYDPIEKGNGSETLATRGFNDLRFIADMTKGGPLEVYVVYLGGLEA